MEARDPPRHLRRSRAARAAATPSVKAGAVSPLASDLAACDKSAAAEPASLPGPKGDVKLDLCYRGRDHLSCGFDALLTEARSLLGDYQNVVEANYPDLGSVEDICKLDADRIDTDLQKSDEFMTRVGLFNSEYETRVGCANKVEQTLRDVDLPDMAQSTAILKSMTDSLEGNIKTVYAAQSQVSDLAAKINAAHKALLTIQRVHRTICGSGQTAKLESDEPTGSVGDSAQVSVPRYYIVLDPVDKCAAVDTKPTPSMLGDKAGYLSIEAANRALTEVNVKCKRAAETP